MGLLTVLPEAGVGFAGFELGLFVSVGLFGASLLDRFRDGDESAGDDESEDPLLDDGGVFGGDADDDADDDLGDFGGMDDWDDENPFGGDEEEDDTAELENRLEDLENEVASLSSTVNTVRSENEEISGQVDDMGEDVRSLLDIYEMVTRGINPFVDDVQTGGLSGGELDGENSFGLFDDDGEGGDEEELDEDLANADAEGFFDEDLIDDGADEEAFDEEEMDDLDEFEDETDSDTMASDNGDGKSFSELKDEYDSGDAEWAGDDEGEDSLDEAAENGEFALDELDADSDVEDSSTAVPTDPTAHADDDGGFEFVEESDLSEEPQKPYLTSLPGDYVGDLMVMEWLEYLVAESNTTDAVRAVNYYERVEWVDESVANQLKAFLSGFGDIDRNLMDRPGTSQLDLDHHTQSLKYIMQLTSATAESVVIDRWPQLSGGLHGPQR